MNTFEIIAICYLLVGAFLSGMYHEECGEKYPKYKWFLTVPLAAALMPIVSVLSLIYEFLKWAWGHIENKSKIPFLFRFYVLKQFRNKDIEWLYERNVHTEKYFSGNSLNARNYRWAVALINKHYGYVYDKEKSKIEYREFINKKYH
jgi:hypothetical protein